MIQRLSSLAILTASALLSPALAAAQTTSAPAAAPAAQPAAAPTTSAAPGTAANPIVVPAGCTAATQPSGQVVIVCPPTGAQTAVAPGVVAPAEGPVAPAKQEPAPEPKPTEESKWYGWQTLIVDGAVLVTGIGATTAVPEVGGPVWLTGYVLGGPIVHWANGQVGKGFASLGIRVGAPLVLGFTGAAVGIAAADGRDTFSDSATAVGLTALGIIAGMGTAIAVDAAALARKTVRVEPPKAAKLNWRPLGGYDPKRQTLTVGVGGTF